MEPPTRSSDPALDREQLLANALADYLDRQARGESVDIDSFCAGYPALAPDLQAQLETVSKVDEMVDSLDGTGRREDTEPSPETLSGHRILEEIGSGGMGRVFLAVDERLGRKVAIKTLAGRYEQDADVRARFMKEARAMAGLSHPNVVRIYSLGQADESPHFVMEYVDGRPLTESARPLTVRQKAELLHKVALAVEFLHRNRVIHRDLKPGNILVGPDLEPRIADFGLALRVDDRERLSRYGEIVGTPDYLSPEHVSADTALDARSDVFSLGVILYELLTGSVPFRAATFSEQLHKIRDEDPALPRRLDPDVPGELQDVCLKALEKNPEARYASAQAMAKDLERYLAGEPVLAEPTQYSRLTAGRIEQHVRELDAWRRDHIVSESEYMVLRHGYDRLVDREDAWIMESRRLSLPQVTLYLGAWILVVGATLLALFSFSGLSGLPAVLTCVAGTVPTGIIGVRCWRQGRLRISVAYLLAFCLLLPVVLVVAMGEYGLLAGFTRNDRGLEFFARFDSFRLITHAQLWWAILLSLPAYVWLRRFTASSVFSLVLAVMGTVLCVVTLLRLGMIEWLDKDVGRVYLHLLPCAVLFFAVAQSLERLRRPSDSRYFYPIAVAFTVVGLSGVAAWHEPYAEWLGETMPWTHGQVEYLFIVNAGIYLLLQAACDRFSSSQMRTVAKAFRFLLPGHVLTSLWLLGLHATTRLEEGTAGAGGLLESRVLEIALPLVACLFVFGSIPKQMRNFFATGMLFLAIGIVRLQRDLFENQALLSICLLIAGVSLMLAAANYSTLRVNLSRLGRRFRTR